MGIFDQRVTNRTQPTAQNRFSNTGATNNATSASNASRTQAYSQGTSFSRGQVVRGEIIDLRNNDVKVQLNGGRILSGKVSDSVGLSIGETATFRVMEATPSSLELKLLSDQRAMSEEFTIDKALESAGLPKSERNIAAVRELLTQGLSVDKNSIQTLLKQSAMFRGVSFHTLALMNKLQIPVTEVNTRQMEAYLNYEHRLMNLAEQAAGELPDAISSALEAGDTAAAAALNEEVLTLLAEDGNGSSSALFAALSTDAPLSSFALFDSNGTLALMDTLEPFGLSESQAASIINGSATLRQAAAFILQTADRLAMAGNPTLAGDSTIAGQGLTLPSEATGLGQMQDNGGGPTAGDSLAVGPDASSQAANGSQSVNGSPTANGDPADNSKQTTIGLTSDMPADQAASANASQPSGLSFFRSLLQGATSLFNGNPTADAPNAEQALAGQVSAEVAEAAREQLLPSQMTLADAISHLPAMLQTPEIYTILGEFTTLAQNSLELSSFLTKSQRMELSSQLKGKLPFTVIQKLEDGELTAAELLKLLLAQSEDRPGQDSSYLSSEAYKEILRQMLLSRFTMRPQDLQQKEATSKYYAALDKDLAALEKLQTRTLSAPAFQNTAANMRDNIDFMKTINQIFPYLQLPMKLSHQNVHAELYVYTKKEQRMRDPSSISVLLHLDMEQLGPLDIHLDLENKNLQARFYLANASSAAITQENFSLLRQALAAKGYTLDARAEERKNNTGLVRSLLSPEKEGVSMKRYSFDIRA